MIGWATPLALGDGDPAQRFRLAHYRAAHPEVIIGDGGFGTFQARIPARNGETVITRHLLRELLDKLEEIAADGPEPDSG